MAIDMETFTGASEVNNEESEREIYDRLIAELEKEKKQLPLRPKFDQAVAVALHGEQSGLLHAGLHEEDVLNKMIVVLGADIVDRPTIIHWLKRKIENESEHGKDTKIDEKALQHLKLLEYGRDERMAA